MTLDACMMMEMTKIDIVQGQIVFDKMFVQFGINPSILEWQEHLLMATSLGWPIGEAPGHKVSGKLPSECVEFNWVNRSSLNSTPLVRKGQLTEESTSQSACSLPFRPFGAVWGNSANRSPRGGKIPV